MEIYLNNSINSLSFSPDGKAIAIASNDKRVILWYLKRDDWEKLSRTELKELVKKACGVVGNYLKHKPKDNSDRTLCPDIGEK
jgi:WD40 repeat protein